ncbi:MAG TPA: response regulator [Bryobacteraceae bacterium]|nr:response regulator [Bryobacteraceae bacterium]
MLKQRGYVAIPAVDCGDALKPFRSRQRDLQLLFTDIDMPDMSGFQLSQTVLAEQPNVRVLLMSGSPENHKRLPF